MHRVRKYLKISATGVFPPVKPRELPRSIANAQPIQNWQAMDTASVAAFERSLLTNSGQHDGGCTGATKWYDRFRYLA